MKKRRVSILSVVVVPAVVLPIVVAGPAQAAAKPALVAPAVAPAPKPAPKPVVAGALAPGRSNVISPQDYFKRHLTPAQRRAAAARATAKGRVSATARQASAARAGQKVLGAKGAIAGVSQANLAAAAAAATSGGEAAPRIQTSPRLTPGATPDYFGTVPNYANSPLPEVDGQGNVIRGTGIRKFVDALPGIGSANKNLLGNYIPVAHPDTTTFPGSDYYVIAVKEYSQKMHSDLPATTLRGYVQLNNGTDPATGQNTVAPDPIMFLGPTIVSTKDRPARVMFVNQLPTTGTCDRTVRPAGSTGCGDLFLPVDTTMMGAGMGPLGMNTKGKPMNYSQNRATVHLHGGFTPWISDGTPHQWITPSGENTAYPKGVSVANVPDMWYVNGNPVPKGTPGATNDPGAGRQTFFYTNAQSARLMFYHDHSYGITRLNVYAGEGAPYLLNDRTEQALVNNGTIPQDQIPLVIQDKTFVPKDAQLNAEDPTWNKAKWGGQGNLWYPHVYMPNQNPSEDSGANAMGRWDYGPWFWPPYTGLAHGPVPNPLCTRPGDQTSCRPGENVTNPGVPNVSSVMESFMDTPLVNGTPYPYTQVAPKAYQLRILNASDDRSMNLQLYYAKSNASMWNADGTLNDANAGEVPMIEASPSAKTAAGCNANWPTDGRDGGVPDCSKAGPPLIQVGNEGGLLPQEQVINSQPVNYDYNRKTITVLNVTTKSLFLAPAERADVIVDFSKVPAGSKLVLYNDAPVANPALDPRYDYYTGDPDQTATGGAPSTLPGYGPNTRTLMQFQVGGTPGTSFDLAKLHTALPQAYRSSQPAPIVPQVAYNVTGQTNTTVNNYVRIQDNTLTYKPTGATAAVTLPLGPKAIQELFEVDYGRMNATGGVELPNTSATTQTTIPMGYAEPTTEVISPSDLGRPIGSLADGTQIWKFTHNGVDVHPVHFHLFDVQLLNRVGWDGSIRAPDANELGWKETVRMEPLTDTIVALRPAVPPIPFKIGDSYRPIDVTMPTNAVINTFDPTTGQAITVPNAVTNYGWEYVWHCHMLSHEEMDLMRPMVLSATPAAATNLTFRTAATGPPFIMLSWQNNARTAQPALTNYTLERATNAAFTQNVTDINVPGNSTNTTVSYADTSAVNGTVYYYRVRSESAAAYAQWSPTVQAATSVGTPTALTAAVKPTAPIGVNLTWANGTPVGNGITIQRATNSSFTSGARTFTLTGAPTSYTDTTVANNTTYWYRVRATFGPLTSGWSASATLRVAAPAQPNLTLAMITTGRTTATVNWTIATPPAVGTVTVQRMTSAGFPQSTVTFKLAGSARSFNDAGLKPYTMYFYWVNAANSAGVSAWSTLTAALTKP